MLDPAANASAKGEAPISAADSRAQIWVVPTNEEIDRRPAGRTTVVGGLEPCSSPKSPARWSPRRRSARWSATSCWSSSRTASIRKTASSLVTTGRTFVAVDTVGAGEGEFVLITQGSSARLTPETKNLPIDTVIIGIVDTVHVDQHVRVQPRRATNRDSEQRMSIADRPPTHRHHDSPAQQELAHHASRPKT